MISITVHVKNTETGRVVEHKTSLKEDPNYVDGYSLSQWEEGNYSCDCCRALLMDEDDNIPCGEWNYRVKIIRDDTGELIYNEW